jgi:hypothetical protein
LLEIARKVDSHDDETVDMYAGEIAMDFSRAGFRNIATGLRAASPGANDEAISKAFERMTRKIPFDRECVQGIRTQIRDAMKSMGKNTEQWR